MKFNFTSISKSGPTNFLLVSSLFLGEKHYQMKKKRKNKTKILWVHFLPTSKFKIWNVNLE